MADVTVEGKSKLERMRDAFENIEKEIEEFAVEHPKWTQVAKNFLNTACMWVLKIIAASNKV